jgi:hypothetical protein
VQPLLGTGKLEHIFTFQIDDNGEIVLATLKSLKITPFQHAHFLDRRVRFSAGVHCQRWHYLANHWYGYFGWERPLESCYLRG